MKAKELAGYLLEHPDWDVRFSFVQVPDEINGIYERVFEIVDVGDGYPQKIIVLIGEESEK